LFLNRLVPATYKVSIWNPEKVYYTRSHFFTFTEKGSSEENWMFPDEYEHREDYDKWMKAVLEDPELMKIRCGPILPQGSCCLKIFVYTYNYGG